MPAAEETIVGKVRALAQEIRDRAGEAEAGRRMPLDLVAKLKTAGAFRMLAPRSHGGLEADFPTALETITEAARADGSAGWTVMIGSATGLLFSRLPRETFDAIYAGGPDVIQAGLAGAPLGRAEQAAGGYRVSGRWPFSSGCQHADWIIGLAVVTKDGTPVPGDQPGPPMTRIVALPASEWTIEDTWDVAGLKGTGSHHTTLADHFVPESQVFELAGPSCLPGPVYDAIGPWIPLMHGAFAVGVAAGALDDLVEMASGGRQQLFARTPMRDSLLFQYEFGELAADLEAARALLKVRADAHWARALEGKLGDPANMGESLQAGVWITAACVKITGAAFTLGGGQALYDASPLQRRMRDMHAAAQHAVVQQKHYQTLGASRLGHQPGGILSG